MNDLLSKGQSMAVPTSDAEYEQLLNSVDSILFTDYEELVKKDERGNA